MRLLHTAELEATLEPLNTLFTESCADVFISLNCDVYKIEGERPNLDAPCVFIDASSEDITLTLLLRGPLNFLKKTYPMQNALESFQTEALYDWLSELANRFMGDLKNKLIPFDHTLQIGIPQKQFNLDVEHFLPDGYYANTLLFNIGGELFECSLYTKLLSEDVVFQQQAMCEVSCSSGGELELF